MKNKVKSFALLVALLPAVSLSLTGCWTPPNANVQPAGKPGLIQASIPVELIYEPVTVESKDTSRRTITLKPAEGAAKTFYVDATAQNFDRVQAGEVIKATVKAEMAIYLLQNGRLTNPDGTTHAKTINFNAKVLTVDPSYRLLTLQFPNGRTMTIKAGLNVLLEKMAPGDDVVIRSHEVMTISSSKR